jgi:hypothetical protein
MQLISNQEFAEYMAGFEEGTPKNLLDWCAARKGEALKQGRIEYVFKPASTYPARIYAFYNASEFAQRNRKLQGCMNVPAFAERWMCRAEAIERHFDTRMYYLQFESFHKLVDSEIETLGPDHPFIEELKAFESKYAPLLKGVYSPKQKQLF